MRADCEPRPRLLSGMREGDVPIYALSRMESAFGGGNSVALVSSSQLGDRIARV